MGVAIFRLNLSPLEKELCIKIEEWIQIFKLGCHEWFFSSQNNSLCLKKFFKVDQMVNSCPPSLLSLLRFSINISANVSVMLHCFMFMSTKSNAKGCHGRELLAFQLQYTFESDVDWIIIHFNLEENNGRNEWIDT